MADQIPVRAAGGLRLICRPGKSGGTLLFPYTLENQGSDEVYAMHALKSIDPASGEARANYTAGIVIASETGDAIAGKFAAPLPTEQRVAMPVLPLARRLPVGASLEGRVEIRAAARRDQSLFLRSHAARPDEIVDIKGVQLTIGYWLAGHDGLDCIPADYGPDLFDVVTRNTMRSALRISQRYPTTGLQLFKRTDAFPRTLA